MIEKFIQSGRPVSEDVFVLVPGIIGSELYVDGAPVWSPKPSAIFGALRNLGNNLKRLELSDDADAQDDLGDGVTVGRVIPDVHLIPGLKKIDGYSRIGKTLAKRFDLISERNYFEFAYDWRRDNRVIARRLQTAASIWLNAWRQSRNSDDPKLILVCHSMGGLVARYFLEVLGGWRDTRALITFGTPFRGSVKALNYVSNGYVVGDRSLELIGKLVRSFTSIYQLMPIYDCCSSSPEASPSTLTDIRSVPNVNLAKVRKALAFHQELREAAETNRRNADYTRNRYEVCSIIGIGQPTPAFAYISPAGLKISLTEGGVGGDGTVSRVSAEPPKGEPLSTGHFVNEFHGSLQNNESAWWEIQGVLERLYLMPSRVFLITPKEIMTERINAMPLDPAVELRLSDAFSTSEEVRCEIRRRDGDIKPSVSISIKSCDSDETVTRQVTLGEVEQWCTVAFGKLKPGAYRCSVSASSHQRGYLPKTGAVTDVFLVI